MAPPYSRIKIPLHLLPSFPSPDLPIYSMSSLFRTVVAGNRSLKPPREAVTSITMPDGTGTVVRNTLPEDGTAPFHISYPMALTSIKSVPSGRGTSPLMSEMPMSVLSVHIEAPIIGKPLVSVTERFDCDIVINTKSNCTKKNLRQLCKPRRLRPEQHPLSGDLFPSRGAIS